jgi:uncharacterized protein
MRARINSSWASMTVASQHWLTICIAAAMIATATGSTALFWHSVPWHFVSAMPAIGTIVAVGVAAFLSGIAGFAFSAICGAIIFHFRHDTVGVVQIMLVCSIANQALSVWILRRDIRLRVLAPFVIGGIVGVPAGVWLLLDLNAATYVKGVGTIILAYGLYMLVRPPIVLRRSTVAGDVASGLIGGVIGGFTAIPGAAVSIWCSMKGWNKVAQRAVFQPFILLMQFAALAAIAMMHPRGGPSAGIPALAWACVPAGLFGTWWGLACFRRLTDRQFGVAINLLLIVSGAGLLL